MDRFPLITVKDVTKSVKQERYKFLNVKKKVQMRGQNRKIERFAGQKGSEYVKDN